jgi:type IV pilus assembly protein PilY1
MLHWEFTDANDADMGFSFARPQIVRMQTGKWAAVFGNGYNNTFADGPTSTSGDAVLYVVDLESGAIIKKIDTKQGTAQDPTNNGRPNGLSTPVVVDVNNDSIADFAYAGDLFGNLWKFDLNSSDPGDWKVAYGDATTPAPLFVATNDNGTRQAITSRPNVSRGPNGRGLIVLFGTGKYFETGDGVVANITTQSFYGLLDPNTGASTDVIDSRDSLTTQTITNEVMGVVFFYIDDEGNRHEFPNDVRVTSANLQDADSRGWYIDLVSPSGFQGEMQVTDSIIRNGHVLFTTLVPNADPCGDGGSSWLMELSLFNGARLENTPFELSGNGKFDDKVAINGTDQVISGVRSQVGIEPKGGLISGEKCDFIIFPGSSGNTETRCRDPGARGFGRQSWRQAR